MADRLKLYMRYTHEQWESLLSMEHEISDRPSVYFDIDGTLAKWNANATMEEIFDPANHYFAKVIPEPTVIDLARKLWLDGVDVCIISAAQLDTIPDKYGWIKKHLPFIEDNNIFFCPLGADKSQFIKSNADLSVLIDDYNVNLREWSKTGGIPIKMINGINSERSGFREISFERMKAAEARWQKYIATSGAPEADIENLKKKMIYNRYDNIRMAAGFVEGAIHYNPLTEKKEKE